MVGGGGGGGGRRVRVVLNGEEVQKNEGVIIFVLGVGVWLASGEAWTLESVGQFAVGSLVQSIPRKR